MIQGQFFPNVQPFARRSNIFIRRTLARISKYVFNYWKLFKTWNTFCN